MDAEQLLGMGIAETRSDEGAPIAALDGETGIAQRGVHQFGEAIGDRLDAEAGLPRCEGQTVPRKRRRHDRERVLGIAAKARRVGEAWGQLQELEYRPWPPVQQQKRAG